MQKLLLSFILTLCCCAANAQIFYSLEICRQAYEKRMYETILPSLLHIKNEAENGGKFDAQEYFSASDLLCRIYTDYYKNPEFSARIMEDVYQTLAMKTDSSHTSPIHFAAYRLSEIYRQIYRYDMSQKYLDKAEKMFKFPCNCELSVYLPKEKLSLYRETKNKAKMSAEIQNVLKKYKEFVGDIMTSKDYLAFDVLNNVASAYFELGETIKAEKYWEHILANIKPTDSRHNSLYNNVINSLALIKMNNRQWQEALDLYDKIKIFNDYYDAVYYKNILTCALFAINVEKTRKYYTLLSKEMTENQSQVFFKSTEENHYNQWIETVKSAEFLNFSAFKSQQTPIIANAFDASVFFKNLSTDSRRIIDQYVRTSSDTKLKSAYETSQKIKHKFVFSNGGLKCYEQYERLFDSVLLQSQNLTKKLWNQTKSFESIKSSLSSGEYAIEFCLIPCYEDFSTHTDYYGAYIIGRDFAMPRLIKTAAVKDIEHLLTADSDEQIFFSELYSQEKSQQLYNLIFKPLELLLKNARTIYYSPYGHLAEINFDYLTDGSGTLLNPKIKTIRTSSLAQIKRIKSLNISAAKSAVLFGNIDYGTMPTIQEQTRHRDSDFRKLPSTKVEIQKVYDILTAKNIATKTYEETSANENVFKDFSGQSPDILHIATHGFCLDSDEKIKDNSFAQSITSYSAKESSMVLSGLALSGANNVWKGNFDLPNVEDGILTAYEISQLDLSNTKLVVLSACETARGRIFPVDGVFGLQRAFKQAGAGSILMSLWKVDDNATATFMEYFYKYLFETNDRHEALKMAQDEVKKQYPDPYYWAAWVMLD